MNERTDLCNWLALDRSTHHGSRTLADGATLTTDLDVGHNIAINGDVHLNLVAT